MANILLIADSKEVAKGMRLAGQHTAFVRADSLASVSYAQSLTLLEFDTSRTTEFRSGECNEASGRYTIQTLQIALDAVSQDLADAIVFAPLNKHALHLAGMHTPDEMHWFAERLSFTGAISEFNVLDGLWTSRVTSHIAHKDVAMQLTIPGIEQSITLLYNAMRDCGVLAPRIAVCGLNPHNGDNGSFGREEIDIIAPAVQSAKAKGIPVQGPFAADTLFLKVQGEKRQFDGIVTMYHDQGLAPFKFVSFGGGVNVTLGLPIIRTSVDHGTALDIAGKGLADPGSMLEALRLAYQLAVNIKNTKNLKI
jgi:4-hydroxythreonine-4-phosphate dehydrogenase